MTLIKKIIVECSRCGWCFEAYGSDDKFDEYYEMAETDCPGCFAEFEGAL